MILEMREPCERLQPFITHYVFHQGYIPAHTRERILTYGSMDLIIDLSERPKSVFDNDTIQRTASYRRGWISGMRLDPITIECGSGDPMLVINFKPAGAQVFFGFPMSELTHRIEEGDTLWGHTFFEVRDRLSAVLGTRDMFTVLEQWLLERAGDRLQVDPFMEYAISLLDSCVRPPGMKQLALELGYSQKHMISLFDKMVGMSPKRYARIVRFQKIVQALELGRPRSWSRMAQDFGFYDQAHFNNEFRSFSGFTPEEYLTRKGPFLNFLPVQ